MKLEVEIVDGESFPATEWDALVNSSPMGTVYHLHYYLCATWPQWKAIAVRNAASGALVGAMPLFPKKKYGLLVNLLPLPCRYAGPVVAPHRGNGTLADHNIYCTHVGMALGKAFAGFGSYSAVSLQPEAVPSLQGFLFAGCTLKTKITQRVRLSQDFRTDYQSSLRQRLRRSREQMEHLSTEFDLNTFKTVMDAQMAAGGYGYSPAQWQSVAPVLAESNGHGNGHMLTAMASGKPAACIVWLRQGSRAYYFAATTHPAYKSAAFNETLLDEALGQCLALGIKTFDFQGSSHEGINYFFQKFGSIGQPYFLLHNSRVGLLKYLSKS